MVNKHSITPTEAPYTIEEQFIASKTGKMETCEDALYVGPHFVAVIDGATSKTERRWYGETGGRVAARLVGEALAQLPADATHVQAFEGITAAIQQFYREQGVLDVVTVFPVQRVMAVAAIFSVQRREVWLVGDCQCLLGMRRITPKKTVDSIAALARAMFLEAELLRGVTIETLQQHDTGRDFILPLLERQSYFQNTVTNSYAYTVLDGFPIPEERILIYGIAARVKSVVLASDGYPVLKSSLQASEQALESILDDDPLLFRRYQSTKGLQTGNISFDDRAYIKISLVW